MMAPLAGLILGKLALSRLQTVSPHAGPVMMLLCGAMVLFRAFREQRGGCEGRLLFGLPLSLSLDNVTSGAFPVCASPRERSKPYSTDSPVSATITPT